MSGFLLDTNIISECRKPNGNRNVKAWVAQQKATDLYTSSVVFAEIRYGASQITGATFRHDIEHWIDSTLRHWFLGRTLEVTEEVIIQWRELVQEGRSKNYTFSQPDLFLAAQAKHHNLCLVTRNTKDFQKTGVAHYNPWEIVV